jgi:hypothetical protein
MHKNKGMMSLVGQTVGIIGKGNGLVPSLVFGYVFILLPIGSRANEAGHGGTCLLIPLTREAEVEGLRPKASPSENVRLCLKNKLKIQMAGGMVQVVECLL